MKSNIKGFGAVSFILILVVVGLIGVVGWLVYKNNKPKSTVNNASQVSSQTQQTPSQTQSTKKKLGCTDTPITVSPLRDTSEQCLLITEWNIKVGFKNADKVTYKITTVPATTAHNAFDAAAISLKPDLTDKCQSLGVQIENYSDGKYGVSHSEVAGCDGVVGANNPQAELRKNIVDAVSGKGDFSIYKL